MNPDAILVRSANMLTMEMPASVKAIARAGAGVNNIPVPACSENGIVVFNTPGANANSVKELVIAGLLLCFAQDRSGHHLGKESWSAKATRCPSSSKKANPISGPGNQRQTPRRHRAGRHRRHGGE